MSERQPIDDQFRARLEHAEAEPPAAVWDRIVVSQRRRRGAWLGGRWLVGGLLLAGFGLGVSQRSARPDRLGTQIPSPLAPLVASLPKPWSGNEIPLSSIHTRGAAVDGAQRSYGVYERPGTNEASAPFPFGTIHDHEEGSLAESTAGLPEQFVTPTRPDLPGPLGINKGSDLENGSFVQEDVAPKRELLRYPTIPRQFAGDFLAPGPTLASSTAPPPWRWFVSAQIDVLAYTFEWRRREAEGASLADALNDAERIKSTWGIQFHAGRQWQSGWRTSAGLAYGHVSTHFNHERTVQDREIALDTLWSISSATGPYVSTWSIDSVGYSRVLVKKHASDNRYDLLAGSFQLGYWWRKGILSAGPSLALAPTLFLARRGLSLTETPGAGAVEDVNLSARSLSPRFAGMLMASAGADVGVALSEKLSVEVGANYGVTLAHFASAPVLPMLGGWSGHLRVVLFVPHSLGPRRAIRPTTP
jgi:hypothetical protein